jgi:PAS domain S-box-containing protein
MKDEDKTKNQLIRELAELREQVKALESPETERKWAAEAIEKREERYAELADLLPQTVFECDRNGQITFVNRGFFDAFGYTRADCDTRLNIVQLAAPEDWDRARKSLQKVLAGEEIREAEFTALRKDGQPFPVLVFARPIVRENMPVGCRGFVVNITRRKRVEETLRRSEQRYRTYVDVTKQFAWVTDANGQIVEDVPALRRFTGQTYEEVKGQGWSKAVHPDDVQHTLAAWSEAVSKRTMCEMEYRMRRHDGVYRIVLDRSVPILSDEGQVLEWVGTCMDITERKEEEAKLRESESRFRAIANYTYDCECWFDVYGKLLWINAAVFHLTGYTVEECMAMADFPLPVIHKEDRDRVAMLFTRAMQGTSANDEEFRIRCKDSSLKWAAVSWQPIYDVDGSPLGHRSSVRNITDRKRAEEKVRELNQELAQRVRELKSTNEGLKTFTYSLSHDLRTPLVALRGFSQRLLEKYASLLDEKGRRYLKVINANARQMEVLIADLRAFLSSGRKMLKASHIRMGDMVQGIFHQLRASHPNRTIQLNIKSLPDAKGDEAMIRNVLTNLLDNAVKYSRLGDVTVIEVVGWIENERTVYYVKDNGIGFPMEQADKLFEAFERLHTREDIEGTGLGLAIVKRIIRRHGGDVWAEAKAGEGATFYFSIPR